MPKHTKKERAKKKKGPSAAKAKEILKDGTAQGKPLTKRQKRFFGAKSRRKG